MVAEAERDQRVIGITAAMAGGTGLQKLADEAPEQYYDVGIAEQNAVLLASRAGAPGREAGLRDLLDLPAARLRPDHPRRLPAGARRHLRDGPRRPGRRRRPDPSRRLRHLLLPPDPERGPDGAARRGDAGPHAAHRDRPRRAGGAALPARRGGGGRAAGASREKIPIGSGELLAEGERVALLGYGYGVAVALEAAAILADHGLEATVADARFAKPLDAELARAAGPRARPAGDDRGERAARRLRLGGARAPRGRLRRPPRRSGPG